MPSSNSQVNLTMVEVRPGEYRLMPTFPAPTPSTPHSINPTPTPTTLAPAGVRFWIDDPGTGDEGRIKDLHEAGLHGL
ncbi:hypothetical protein BGAL_0363g00160 [Botrytis galanthina]|uniref:Uncharacterized protein n=1 Tax=Botrytis galanthina TaxID=278940 RepID=A0A4S8QYI8_9HELO|nr:hypothetical protein BGAL_0363g00160 [Botrytis galanthina]